MPAYLDTIVAAHRPEAAGDHRDLDRRQRAAQRTGPSARSSAPSGCHVSGTAWRSSPRSSGGRRPRAISTRPSTRPRWPPTTRPAGPPACRCSPTRSSSAASADDLERGPGRLLPAGAAQGLHRQRPRRVRRPDHGGRRRAADRGRARRRRAGSFLGLAARLSLDRAGRGARRGRARPGPRRRRRRGRGQPAGPAHLRGRPAAGRCDWAERSPTAVVAVAESGIRDADDVARLADAGYHAVLVGETLVRSADRRGGRRPRCSEPRP